MNEVSGKFYRSCKFCGGTVQKVNDRFDLIRCNACSLVFARAVFSDEQIKETYDILYNKSDTYDAHRKEYGLLQENAELRLGFNRNFILDWLQKNGCETFGEVGAGIGLAGAYCQGRNLQYYGVGIDEITARKAQAIGLNVEAGSFDALGKLDNHFDSVLAFESLEHIQDLKSFFGHIFQSLKPGGYLGFTVPNYDKIHNYSSPGERIFQDAPPVHLNFLTISNLNVILPMAGFIPIILRTRKYPYLNWKVFDTYKFCIKALLGKFHGQTILCIAQKPKNQLSSQQLGTIKA